MNSAKEANGLQKTMEQKQWRQLNLFQEEIKLPQRTPRAGEDDQEAPREGEHSKEVKYQATYHHVYMSFTGFQDTGIDIG